VGKIEAAIEALRRGVEKGALDGERDVLKQKLVALEKNAEQRVTFALQSVELMRARALRAEEAHSAELKRADKAEADLADLETSCYQLQEEIRDLRQRVASVAEERNELAVTREKQVEEALWYLTTINAIKFSDSEVRAAIDALREKETG
jgi:uncharacterized protein YlxW (UPF0749 family)